MVEVSFEPKFCCVLFEGPLFLVLALSLLFSINHLSSEH